MKLLNPWLDFDAAFYLKTEFSLSILYVLWNIVNFNFANSQCIQSILGFSVFRFRVSCYRVQNNAIFKNFILICILASSLMLAMEDPVGKANENFTDVS